MAEDFWIEKAQSLEVQNTTLRANLDRVKNEFREIMDLLGARKKGDGSIDINYVQMVERLGPESCLELRAEIDRQHRISGEPGEKPKIRLAVGE